MIVIELSQVDKTGLVNKGVNGAKYYGGHFVKERCFVMLDGVMGAKTLMGISDDVCARMNTLVSFIIRQDMAMRYQHNIRLSEITSTEL